jgi:hypothetical protein
MASGVYFNVNYCLNKKTLTFVSVFIYVYFVSVVVVDEESVDDSIIFVLK